MMRGRLHVSCNTQDHCSQEVDHNDDDSRDGAPGCELLGLVGGILCSIVVTRVVQAVHLGGIDNRNDTQGETAQQGAQDGPHQVVVGLGGGVAGSVRSWAGNKVAAAAGIAAADTAVVADQVDNQAVGSDRSCR